MVVHTGIVVHGVSHCPGSAHFCGHLRGHLFLLYKADQRDRTRAARVPRRRLQMSGLVAFIERLTHEIGVPLPRNWKTMPDVELARRFLQGVNEYFYKARAGIGTYVYTDKGELRPLSEFQRFWEAHHQEVLNPRINRD